MRLPIHVTCIISCDKRRRSRWTKAVIVFEIIQTDRRSTLRQLSILQARTTSHGGIREPDSWILGDHLCWHTLLRSLLLHPHHGAKHGRLLCL